MCPLQPHVGDLPPSCLICSIYPKVPLVYHFHGMCVYHYDIVRCSYHSNQELHFAQSCVRTPRPLNQDLHSFDSGTDCHPLHLNHHLPVPLALLDSMRTDGLVPETDLVERRRELR